MAAAACQHKRRILLTSGKNITIRKAKPTDIDAIKEIADAHRRELGFVRRPSLIESINRHEVFVAQNGDGLVGFMEFHHRRDSQTTLYNVVVNNNYRREGIGHLLMHNLEKDAINQKKGVILLKCPEELPANAFYARLNYTLTRTDSGKSRQLNIWTKNLP